LSLRIAAICLGLVALAALACERSAEPVIACEAVGPARPICGFQNPEDLELLPDGRGLLVSEFGAMEGGRPGAIAHLDLASEARSVLYRGGDGGTQTPGWGDPACPGPPSELSPHGIHLARRPDGALQLLAVNHAGRESVELFEVTARPPQGSRAARRSRAESEGPSRAARRSQAESEGPSRAARRSQAESEGPGRAARRSRAESERPESEGPESGAWSVAWRGCAVAPEGSWLNDVVALPEGGFLATNMLPRRGRIGQILEYVKAAVLGLRTGFALEWQPGRGFAPLPGTEVAFANGIALSADGRTIFLNASIGGKVHRIDRATGAALGSAKVPGPDNSTWAPDGRLLVASFVGPIWETLTCDGLERGACPIAFEIVAVDPQTLATETLYRGSGAPMGGGTVGLRVGDELFIGSFAGDRILRVKLGGRPRS